MPSTSPKRPEHGPDHASRPPARPRDSRRTDDPDGHQGATEDQVGERDGSGPGFDLEPKQEPRQGGVESS